MNDTGDQRIRYQECKADHLCGSDQIPGGQDLEGSADHILRSSSDPYDSDEA